MVRIKIRVRGEEKWVDISRKEALRLSMGRQLSANILRLLASHHRTEKGQPVNLRANPQWIQIWGDGSPDMVVMSHAQTGKTLYGVARKFAAADLGLAVAYVMPTDDARNRFVKEKVNPTIESVPYYAERMRGATALGSVKLKRYKHDAGETSIFYPGCNSAHDMRSFTADCMNIDEYDFCPRENLHLYPERMNYSDYALTYETSTPTLPGDPPTVPSGERSDNIHTRVLAGTDQHYYVKCEHCGHEQELEWTKHIILEDLDAAGRLIGFKVRDPSYDPESSRDIAPLCEKCAKLMDRLRLGAWKPLNPGSRISSYTVNRLNSPMGKPVIALVRQFAEAVGNPTKMQIFYNYTLGRTFASGHVKFTEELFKRCSIEGFYMLERSDVPASCGVDVNVPFFDVQTADYPMEGRQRQRVTWAGKIQGKESLVARIRAMNVRYVCIDQQPELNFATQLQDELMKLGIWCTLVRYASHAATKMITISKAGEQPNDPPLQVTVDRTANIDALYEDMLLGRVGWFCNYAEAESGRVRGEYLKPVRQIEKNENGIESYVWTGKPDHSLHAGVLNRIAGILGQSFLCARPWDEVLMIREDLSEEPTAKKEEKQGDSDSVLILED